MKKLNQEELLAELEVPFPVDQVLWRVTNTANNRTRGQVVAYADPRAYTDRLNALVSPQGWTRNYETVTMNNITRTKRNAEIVTGKILVTCKVTIDGLGTHAGTGEEWADEDNAMTSAEAQAFKRACSCFGLGRYFYDFDAPWVDIDDKGRPKKAPSVAPWMVPDNWRKGQRPSGKAPTGAQQTGALSGTAASTARNGNSAPPSATSNKSRQNGSSNGNSKTGEQSQSGSELDQRIAALEETVGIKLYRWVLREYGHANQPHLVRDVQQKKKILDVLESATCGLRRMEAVLDRIPEQQVSALLAKLQAPPLNEIADMPTLVQVVQGLESIVNGSHPSAAWSRLSSHPHGRHAGIRVSPVPSSRGFENEDKCIDRTELQPVRN
jgi:hypothetical protein